MSELKTFSCRAELQADVEKFVETMRVYQPDFSARIEPHPLQMPDGSIQQVPDVKAEFQSTFDLEEVRDIMREVLDLHVMIQSVREQPLGVNSLERDPSIPLWD
jgi:hypothetical protein